MEWVERDGRLVSEGLNTNIILNIMILYFTHFPYNLKYLSNIIILNYS